MKTIKKIFAALFFIAVSANSINAQTWTQLTNLPATSRYGSSGFTINGKMYLGTGFNLITMMTDFWEYDPVTNAWTQRANFPGLGRWHGVGFAIGNLGYIGSGSSAYPNYVFQNDFHAYNPATNTWSAIASFPGVARYTAMTFVIGTKAYFGMGWDWVVSPYRKDLWEYDQPTNLWTQKADLPGAPRQNPVGFAIGNKGYMGTGYNGSGMNDFWEYDPPTNSWLARANVPGPARYGAAYFVIGNEGYVGIGGFALNDFYKYNPTSNNWTAIANFPSSGRYNPVSLGIGGCGYVSTGWAGSSNYLNDLWTFCCASPSALFPAPTPVCDGTTINFSNTSTGATSYSWNFGDNTSDTATTPSHLYSAPGNYTVVLTATNGCGSSTSTQTVTVNPNPVPVITPSGPTTFCAGGNVDLLASPAGTYLWNTSATTASINVTTSGTFTVTVTDANGCSGVSSPQTITVNPNPTPSISPAGPTTFCAGGSVVLQCLPGNPGDLYLWSTSETTQSINVSSTGTFTVTVTDANGCTGISAPQSVTVNPLPVPLITPDGPLAFCDGGSVNLTASGGVSYLWSTSATTASIAVNTSGIYTVTVTDANNCSASTSETVTVHPLPTVTLSPPGPLTICGNSTITLIANSSSTGSYSWYHNNIMIVSETGGTYTTSDSGSYYVVITDSNGCTASSNVVVITLGNSTIDVTVTSSLANGVCRANTIFIGWGPQSAILTANSVGAVSYLWSTGATTQSITVNAAGTYSVTVWDSAGCVSPATPESQITIEVIDIRCGHAMQKILFCHVPVGNPANPQTICIAPQAVPHHLSNHPGDCVGPCSLYYKVENAFIDEIEFEIYPNPFSNSLIIHSLNTQEINRLNIYDITGRLIISDVHFNESIETGEALSPGVYHLEIISGDVITKMKVVKL